MATNSEQRLINAMRPGDNSVKPRPDTASIDRSSLEPFSRALHTCLTAPTPRELPIETHRRVLHKIALNAVDLTRGPKRAIKKQLIKRRWRPHVLPPAAIGGSIAALTVADTTGTGQFGAAAKKLSEVAGVDLIANMSPTDPLVGLALGGGVVLPALWRASHVPLRDPHSSKWMTVMLVTGSDDTVEWFLTPRSDSPMTLGPLTQIGRSLQDIYRGQGVIQETRGTAGSLTRIKDYERGVRLRGGTLQFREESHRDALLSDPSTDEWLDGWPAHQTAGAAGTDAAENRDTGLPLDDVVRCLSDLDHSAAVQVVLVPRRHGKYYARRKRRDQARGEDAAPMRALGRWLKRWMTGDFTTDDGSEADDRLTGPDGHPLDALWNVGIRFVVAEREPEGSADTAVESLKTTLRTQASLATTHSIEEVTIDTVDEHGDLESFLDRFEAGTLEHVPSHSRGGFGTRARPIAVADATTLPNFVLLSGSGSDAARRALNALQPEDTGLDRPRESVINEFRF